MEYEIFLSSAAGPTAVVETTFPLKSLRVTVPEMPYAFASSLLAERLTAPATRLSVSSYTSSFHFVVISGSLESRTKDTDACVPAVPDLFEASNVTV